MSEESLTSVSDIIEKIDSLKTSENPAYLISMIKSIRDKARAEHDLRSDISLTNELLGLYRHTADRDGALEECAHMQSIISERGLSRTVNGAVCLLNAATTFSAFGKQEEAKALFVRVEEAFLRELLPTDSRLATLYNNMAGCFSGSNEPEKALQYLKKAISVLEPLPAAYDDMAVSYCLMADILYSMDPMDPAVDECMEKAWICLDREEAPQTVYHAQTISKCLTAFDTYGFFKYKNTLKTRMETIYENNR